MTVILKYIHLGSLQTMPSFSNEKEVMRSEGLHSLLLNNHSAQIIHQLKLSLWRPLLRKFIRIK